MESVNRQWVAQLNVSLTVVPFANSSKHLEQASEDEVVFQRLSTEENAAIQAYCKSEDGEANIEGGSLAPKDAFPYSGVFVNKSTGITSCGLTLISDFHLLTARHCAYEAAIMIYETLLGGICRAVSDTCPAVDMTVISEFVDFAAFPSKDEGSSFKLARYDIAIVQLRKRLPSTVNAKPACLPTPETPVTSDHFWITGFGRAGDLPSAHLRFAEQRLATDQNEYYWVGTLCTMPYFACTVPVTDKATPGARGGDSGSALLMKDNFKTIIGIQIRAVWPDETYDFAGTTSVFLPQYRGDMCRLLGLCDEGADPTQVHARFTKKVDFPRAGFQPTPAPPADDRD